MELHQLQSMRIGYVELERENRDLRYRLQSADRSQQSRPPSVTGISSDSHVSEYPPRGGNAVVTRPVPEAPRAAAQIPMRAKTSSSLSSSPHHGRTNFDQFRKPLHKPSTRQHAPLTSGSIASTAASSSSRPTSRPHEHFRTTRTAPLAEIGPASRNRLQNPPGLPARASPFGTPRPSGLPYARPPTGNQGLLPTTSSTIPSRSSPREPQRLFRQRPCTSDYFCEPQQDSYADNFGSQITRPTEQLLTPIRQTTARAHASPAFSRDAPDFTSNVNRETISRFTFDPSQYAAQVRNSQTTQTPTL